MSLSTQPYKGARDFYPEDKRVQRYMFEVIRQVVERYGYQEYDAPILESLDLYLSKSSEEIVAEQTYNFMDRGGRNVTLRPEMTPSVSRMVAGRRQELAYPLRWYSIPDLWRYERPQAGRLRQHYQLNVDIFGVSGIEADHEIIQVADSILKAFGAGPDTYDIRINSRKHFDKLFADANVNDDNKTELVRLIDKKAKIDHQEFQKQFSQLVGENKSAKLIAALEDTATPPKVVTQLLGLLEKTGVQAVYDPSLARGFDYYTDIVFEVFDKHPENNRSMFGGGRYDGLVGLFGVEPVPTVGFGMGDVTLKNFLEIHKLLPKLKPQTDAVAILIGDVYAKAQPVLRELRAAGVRVAADSSGRKLDAQIRSAVKAGVRYAIFVGDKELQSGRYQLRDLKNGSEKELTAEQIVSAILEARAE